VFKNFEEDINMLNSKKIASLGLALAMTATMAVPAFAANETTVSATYSEPEISVTVPSTGTIAINPYGLPVKFEKSDGTTASITNQQITTAPLTIRNEGKDSALGAYVTVSSKVGSNSGVGFINEDPTTSTVEGASTSKKIFLTLEGQASATTGAAGDTLEDALIEEFCDSTKWTAPTQLTLDGDGALTTKSQIATLEALDADGKYQAGSIALIRLTGKLVEDPESAWTTKDSFTTTIAFTFKTATGSTGSSTVVSGSDSSQGGGDGGQTVTPSGDD
jgi:hypothetical protein